MSRELISQLEYRLRDHLHITCRVEPKARGSLPRFEGKAVRVVDER